jgi:hypothetical protein
MSKVFSFRLSDVNPREAQAKKIIESRVEEGYSLRQIIVEALIAYQSRISSKGDINHLLERLEDIIMSFNPSNTKGKDNPILTSAFLDSIKQSAKKGIRIERN